ncbi:MAG: ABC transporter permease [Planctomycetales bacterium]|nr:ABC transporter permease [Planctomycetales bacterium]
MNNEQTGAPRHDRSTTPPANAADVRASAVQTIGDRRVRIDSPLPLQEWTPSEETVVEASGSWPRLELDRVWRFRELMYELAWRDVQVRYKQTILGAAWAVIQPTLMMIVFTFFVGKFAKFSTGGMPGPVFFYSGFLPWTLYSTGLSRSGNSVVGSVNLITKIYFPRLIVPFAAMGPPIIDFLVAIGVLGLLMAWYGIVPSAQILLAPVAVAVLVAAALAGGLFLAALNVSYRDFRYVIPFLVQLWMFATPAIFMDVTQLTTAAKGAETVAAADANGKATASPETENAETAAAPAKPSRTTKWLMAVNPLNGIIAFFRAATLGTPLPWMNFGIATAMVTTALAASLFYYRRVEDTFADVI